MTLKVFVTQEHIDKATATLSTGSFNRLRSCVCPVALALRDVGLSNASVARSRIVYTNKGAMCELRVPESVDTFVEAFDACDVVRPFTFDIYIPSGEHHA